MTDVRQLPYLLELLDDDSPLVRQTVIRELASFGVEIYDQFKKLPVEITPKDKELLNRVLEVPRRVFLKREWPAWFGLPDDKQRLEAALNLLAEFQSGLEFRGVLNGLLDQLAWEFHERHSTADAHALADFLFKEKAFTGADGDYYSPQNSNLIYVIKHRQGIPISLSCVYMMVGWRLGLDIKGCNLPRHFLTIIPDGKSKKLVDCFHSGKVVGEKEIATLSRESTLNMQEALKLEADSMSIVRRVLGNLIFAYQQVDREKDSFLMVHLLKEVQFYQDHLEHAHSDPKGFGVPPEVLLYRPGQMVQHLEEGYRGIVVDYDLYCVHDQAIAEEEDRPDYNQPWYKVLIHQTDKVLYVPHAQLIQDRSGEGVCHPLVSYFFSRSKDGVYLRNNIPWLD